jgi:hypothetical protein
MSVIQSDLRAYCPSAEQRGNAGSAEHSLNDAPDRHLNNVTSRASVFRLNKVMNVT